MPFGLAISSVSVLACPGCRLTLANDLDTLAGARTCSVAVDGGAWFCTDVPLGVWAVAAPGARELMYVPAVAATTLTVMTQVVGVVPVAAARLAPVISTWLVVVVTTPPLQVVPAAAGLAICSPRAACPRSPRCSARCPAS